MKILILIFVLAVGMFGQIVDGPPETPQIKLETIYDKFEDITMIRTGWRPVEATGRFASLYQNTIRLEADCGFEGKGERVFFSLNLMSQSKDWKFLTSRDGFLLIDGVRLELGEGKRHSSIHSGSVTEWLYYKSTRTDLTKIANAKLIEAKFGGFETTIPSDIQQGVKQLLVACK